MRQFEFYNYSINLLCITKFYVTYLIYYTFKNTFSGCINIVTSNEVVDCLLHGCKRHRAPTRGDGNCLFHAVSMQLKDIDYNIYYNSRGSNQSAHVYLRCAIANESKSFVKPMNKYHNAWNRGSSPKNASEYYRFISKDGTWAHYVDLYLMASVLHKQFHRRLIILDDRQKELRVVHIPSACPVEFIQFMGQTKIEPNTVLREDVVVLLTDEVHFSACVNCDS